MSKKMTPCERLGYKVGDEFEVISHHAFKKGHVVTLHKYDGTECPLFAGDGGGAGVFDGVECSFAILNQDVRKIANKLKPSKQALADAIHQNGGWPKECHWMFAASNGFGSVYCWTNKPKRSGWNWLLGGKFTLCCEIGSSITNWHQCILSRDEYFTAYPEQVKVEVKNETKNQVEVEMKSESEMTINASDWHKNGELPPAGTWCTLHAKENNGEEVMFIGVTSCNSPVFETVQNMIFVERGEFRFSPLRTERERAIDEIISTAKKIGWNSEMANQIIGEVAVELYEAGYRKEVK